jgi:peptide deformylase
MIYPIVAFGSPILKTLATDIEADYPQLKELIENMWETMYNAHGVGLAAPQIGKAIRLFVMDTLQLEKLESDERDEEDIKRLKNATKKVFINAHITRLEGEEWFYNEGCLSIPNIREDVYRPEQITITYCDVNFKQHTEVFNGINARVILHEYDHIEGILFTDHLKPLKKKLLKTKLDDISKGYVKTDYRMKFGVK